MAEIKEHSGSDIESSGESSSPSNETSSEVSSAQSSELDSGSESSDGEGTSEGDASSTSETSESNSESESDDETDSESSTRDIPQDQELSTDNFNSDNVESTGTNNEANDSGESTTDNSCEADNSEDMNNKELESSGDDSKSDDLSEEENSQDTNDKELEDPDDNSEYGDSGEAKVEKPEEDAEPDDTTKEAVEDPEDDAESDDIAEQQAEKPEEDAEADDSSEAEVEEPEESVEDPEEDTEPDDTTEEAVEESEEDAESDDIAEQQAEKPEEDAEADDSGEVKVEELEEDAEADDSSEAEVEEPEESVEDPEEDAEPDDTTEEAVEESEEDAESDDIAEQQAEKPEEDAEADDLSEQQLEELEEDFDPYHNNEDLVDMADSDVEKNVEPTKETETQDLRDAKQETSEATVQDDKLPEKDKPLDIDQTNSTPDFSDVKDRIRQDMKTRAENPSGYKNFDKGEYQVLTDNPAKLSSKNFDRLAKERGWSPEKADEYKYSMSEYQRPYGSAEKAKDHHKDPEQYAKVRHVLEPEQGYVYGSKDSLDKYPTPATGKFVTPDIQEKPNRSEREVATEELALPNTNKADIRSEVTLNPTTNDGKQHNVIEGTAAPQNKEDSDPIFKSDDGLDRHGGGRQIITDGGFESGAVTEGDRHHIGDATSDGLEGYSNSGNNMNNANASKPSMHDNLHDPDLFEKNAPGDYTYESNDNGKKAYGSLEVSDDGVRDVQAQRNAGGENRRFDDDGGHLIGTRFNGAPDSRNLDAQNSNLNRGSYNQQEKSWQDSLNNGDKVYVNVETPRSNGSERPDAYMGYTITEHPDGSREWDAFSYQNASKAEQEAWNKELDDFEKENPEEYYNPMTEIYEKNDYINGGDLKREDFESKTPKSNGTRELKSEELGYHDGKAKPYNESKSDLKNAQDDLDYANQQEAAYNRAVKEGRVKDDSNIRDQFALSKKSAQDHLNKVKDGQSYSYDKPSDYWDSPEGRKNSGKVGETLAGSLYTLVTKETGVKDPTYNASDASKSLGRFVGENYGSKILGGVSDTSRDLMRNTYDTYSTDGDRFKQKYFMRDSEGNPIDAAEGRKLSGIDDFNTEDD